MGLFSRDRRLIQIRKMSVWEITWRVAAIAVLLSVGVGVFAWILMDINNRDDGWAVLDVNTANVHCGDDFTLNYFFGKEEGTQAQAITQVYTEAAEKAYWLFNATAESETYKNVHYINHHVGEMITVDPVLYDAFVKLEKSGCRNLYLGPVYAHYNNLFSSEEDTFAQEWDPRRNEDAAAYVGQVAKFANDTNSISLELLGSNMVQLKVSDEYLAFARENEITEFLDFHWMTNAFIIDFLAQSVYDAGYPNFYLSSVDGFTRRMDSREVAYTLNLYDIYEDVLYPPAKFQYAKPLSIVSLRDYVLLETDKEFYYTAPDGQVTTSYIDPADGLCKSADDTLIVYSAEATCAETLLEAVQIYIADGLDTNRLKTMAETGFHSIRFDGTVIRATDPTADFYSLFSVKDLAYTLAN